MGGSLLKVDVEQFLTAYCIPYRSDGPNCAPGHVVCRCPLCGANDPSEHMGIRISDGAWACWRDAKHRGRDFSRLAAHLLGIPHRQAKEIVEDSTASLDDFHDLRERVMGLFTTQTPAQNEAQPVPWPEGVEPLNQDRHGKAAYYLHHRGIDNIADLGAFYDLQVGVDGEWKDRLLFPVHCEGRRVNYTGRKIQEYKMAQRVPRYKTLPNRHAAVPMNDIVYRPPDEHATGGEALLITEGPFDAIRLDDRLRHRNIRATCTFGMACTQPQILDLLCLGSRFNALWVVFDVATDEVAYKLAHSLAVYEVGVVRLPVGVKDPAELTKEKIDQLGEKVLAFRSSVLKL